MDTIKKSVSLTTSSLIWDRLKLLGLIEGSTQTQLIVAAISDYLDKNQHRIDAGLAQLAANEGGKVDVVRANLLSK